MELRKIFPDEDVEDRGHHDIIHLTCSGGQGDGRLVHHELLEGIDLIFDELECESIHYHGTVPPGMIEVNHCKEGHYDVSLSDGRLIRMKAGDSCVNLTSRIHEFGVGILPMGHYRGLTLLIDPTAASRSLKAFLPELTVDIKGLQEKLEARKDNLLLINGGRLDHLFRNLDHELYTRDKDAAKLCVIEALIVISSLDADEHEGVHWSPIALRRVHECFEYIEANPATREGIKELSRRFALSSTLLRSCFKSEYKVTLGSFLRKKRLTYAGQLLLSRPSLSIAQVAEKAGYANHSRFSSAFRSLYGLSPSEYRQNAGR